MGTGRRITKWSFPTWVQTLDLSIAFGNVQIKGWCSKCGKVKPVDFVKLREIKGGDFSLINKRTRCKLTEGCSGWVKFHYKHGIFRPLWDDDTSDRWCSADWAAEKLSHLKAASCPDECNADRPKAA